MTANDPSLSSILPLAAVVAIVLFMLYRRQAARIKASRASLYENCYELFESYRVEQAGRDFPTLTGRYQARDFQIDAIVDTLTFRKLPVLWLRVTLLQSIQGIATVDILVRAQNTEFYAPANDLPFQLSVPADWPDGAYAKTDDPDAVPPIDLLRRHMAFFDLPQAKEILLTPRGVRLVRVLDQGTRPDYLVLRVADFSRALLLPDDLSDLMDRCIHLADDLTAAMGDRA